MMVQRHCASSRVTAALIAALAATFAFPLAAHGTYDPKHGRWLQRDPIGVKADAPKALVKPLDQFRDGGNLYGYVRSRPTVAADPSGLAGVGGISRRDILTGSRNALRCFVNLSQGVEDMQRRLQDSMDVLKEPQNKEDGIAEVTSIIYLCECCEMKFNPENVLDRAGWGQIDADHNVSADNTNAYGEPPKGCCPFYYIFVHSETNGWPALPAHLPTPNEVAYICDPHPLCKGAFHQGLISDEYGNTTRVSCPYTGPVANRPPPTAPGS